MSHLFISYARKNKEFVSRLHDELERRQRSTWVDWEGIRPTAEWLAEIYGAIEAAQAFVFVVTPDSVASEVCRKELEHAIEVNKRLIPLVAREADSEAVPDSIRQLNWIFAREEDDFEKAIDTLICHRGVGPLSVWTRRMVATRTDDRPCVHPAAEHPGIPDAPGEVRLGPTVPVPWATGAGRWRNPLPIRSCPAAPTGHSRAAR